MRKALTLILLLAMVACGGNTRDKKTPSPAERLEELRIKYGQRLEEAKAIRDQDTGWLARNDCDGMIWAGKYAASHGVDDVRIEAAEYPEAPGKFARRPAPYCWTKDGGDQGSRTEWSRDMFIAGLLPYSWLKERRDILERHASYGSDNNWMMGDPLDDGRVLYTPALIGVLYKAIIGLGGESSIGAIWPDVFPSGLVDYQAHLQVMSIWVQGEIAHKLGDGDAMPGGRGRDKATGLRVSDAMFDRLKEHSERQYECSLYQAVYGMYSGDMGPAVGSLLEWDIPRCDYLRCEDQQCYLADWIFAASLTLTHFNSL